MELLKESKAIGSSVGILLVAKTDTGCVLGASAIGGRGINAERVGANATKSLIFNIKKGGCVDEYLQDQLILYAALAKGTSTLRCGPITKHTETAIHFVQLLTGATFQITSTQDRKSSDEVTYFITCNGIGFENKNLNW